MSWIRRRPLTALFALALALRAACAVATEYAPIFPAYYYTDAARTHDCAAAALEDARAGRTPVVAGAPGERVQIFQTLAIYRLFGPRPLAAKLFTAALGALAVAAFAWAAAKVFPARAALGAGLLMAVWPSHVFYTSQNLKEAPVGLLAYAAMGAAFAAGSAARGARPRAAALALGAGLALLGAGVYRPLVPAAYDPYSNRTDSPTSPEGITRFRNVRQSADKVWARNFAGREIGSQIYPEAVFKTWLDVLLYLPKGAFTVLFMPLPGLYPMEGKLGRWAAAAENAALLALALLAAAGIARGAMRLERLALLACFAAMTAGAALLEFDLGSAGRHKLLYLPLIFPFAAEKALRLLGHKEPA